MPIETLASQGEQQRTADIRMRAKLVHHPVGVSVGKATAKAD
jgi:hypothetical protein